MEPKQVIAVRKDLNMRKGKLAAQVAHASMAVILDMMSKERLSPDTEKWSLLMSESEDVFQWLHGPFVKIVVSVETYDDLMQLYVDSKLAGLPCALIQDAGRTEFHGDPTYTCIAIGPGNPEKIDKLTGHLKLL